MGSYVKALEKHAVIHEEQVDSLIEGKRTADAWRSVHLQRRPLALAVRSDVGAFAKGKRSKGSGKGTDVCKHCGKKGHWARDCRGRTRRRSRDRNERR